MLSYLRSFKLPVGLSQVTGALLMIHMHTYVKTKSGRSPFLFWKHEDKTLKLFLIFINLTKLPNKCRLNSNFTFKFIKSYILKVDFRLKQRNYVH